MTEPCRKKERYKSRVPRRKGEGQRQREKIVT